MANFQNMVTGAYFSVLLWTVDCMEFYILFRGVEWLAHISVSLPAGT
jgi:hypothetical protein